MDWEELQQWVESWKQWHGYKVTSCGIIVSDVTEFPIYQLKSRSRKGYYYKVKVTVDGRKRLLYVHRIVAECFLKDDLEGLEVDHGPGGTLDNRVVNLKVVTPEENKRLHLERARSSGSGSRLASSP
jgi:hypothetical protein